MTSMTSPSTDRRPDDSAAGAAGAARDLKMSLHVHQSTAALEGEWREFEQHAVCSVFQSYRWLTAWEQAFDRPAAARTAVVTGRDPGGRLRFIMPFVLRRRYGITVLEWPGARHSNYQMGLYDTRWLSQLDAAEFRRLWGRILDALPPFDAAVLVSQPYSWARHANPLAHLPHMRSANVSWTLGLTDDFAALYAAKRTPATRRSAAKRDRRLARAGKLEFAAASSPAERERALLALVEQKRLRIRELGIGDMFGIPFRRFVDDLAAETPQDPSPLRLYTLSCDGEIIAVTLGVAFAGCYHGLVLSITGGPLRRHSPGDLALRHTIEACIAEGLTRFDMAQGDTAYKKAWADAPVELFDCVIARTARGAPFALSARASLLAKRKIKNTAILWSAAQAARRLLAAARLRRSGE